MIEDRIHQVRQSLDNQAADMPPATRALHLRLCDALDRLQAMYRGGPGDGQAPAMAQAVRGAVAEFEGALAAAAASLDASTVAACQALADLLAAEAAPRHGIFRARRGDPPTAPAARAIQPCATPVAPTAPAAWAPHASAQPVVPPAAEVRFAASAPRTARPGRALVARFLAYAEADEAQALARLGNTAGQQVESGLGGLPVAVGAELDIAVSGANLQVEGAPRCVQRLVWRGGVQRLDFEVEPTAGFDGGMLRLDVLLDGLVLARIRLTLACATDTSTPAADDQHSSGHRLARKAFASYASADRQRVLDRVASVRLASALQIFLDCHDLFPGQAWQPRLAQEIDGCDAFLLFWSDAAAASTWVRWEWERALHKHGLAHLQFHPLDNGVTPPPELAELHADDPLMDLRQAHAQRLAARGAPHA
ncbi:toll/interleukin-1 receptor domain-containing protein [Pseudorhodoferax sp. Leaf267]|uniref:toll/interleukin-1 receptor domain-containing protein n=1 Tax=Pseudorhodoferax sp. Leaf267 TaxID=1736316 RepID=UPI0006FD9763|nr:toll/interleukin-1 receptor domain-containing protein [Pseudorhodoferax sp. Leaf267]KQP13696.1 hypothetical protein ASF43_17525 [Pseudorhodoferax sp. Leaf267]